MPHTARADTPKPFTPEPTVVQLLPFHLAMLPTALPPAVVKSPPANKSNPETASAYTPEPLMPELSGDQVLPFHLAMLVAAMPSAIVKLPPA